MLDTVAGHKRTSCRDSGAFRYDSDNVQNAGSFGTNPNPTLERHVNEDIHGSSVQMVSPWQWTVGRVFGDRLLRRIAALQAQDKEWPWQDTWSVIRVPLGKRKQPWGPISNFWNILFQWFLIIRLSRRNPSGI